MAPIQRQRRRGLHTVHRVSLQQFRKSVLRQSTVTDNIGQSVPGTRCSSSKGTVAEGRVHSDDFQHLMSSTTCPRTTTTSPAAVGCPRAPAGLPSVRRSFSVSDGACDRTPKLPPRHGNPRGSSRVNLEATGLWR